MIANKLAITNTGTKQENEQYAVYVMLFVAVFAIVVVVGFSSIVNISVPYFFALLLAIGIVIPWMLFNIYYEMKLAKLI